MRGSGGLTTTVSTRGVLPKLPLAGRQPARYTNAVRRNSGRYRPGARGSDGAPGSAPSRVARSLPDDPPALPVTLTSRRQPAARSASISYCRTLAPLARY